MKCPASRNPQNAGTVFKKNTATGLSTEIWVRSIFTITLVSQVAFSFHKFSSIFHYTLLDLLAWLGYSSLFIEDSQPGGGGDFIPSLPGCVCPKVMDMGPFLASSE